MNIFWSGGCERYEEHNIKLYKKEKQFLVEYTAISDKQLSIFVLPKNKYIQLLNRIHKSMKFTDTTKGKGIQRTSNISFKIKISTNKNWSSTGYKEKDFNLFALQHITYDMFIFLSKNCLYMTNEKL